MTVPPRRLRQAKRASEPGLMARIVRLQLLASEQLEAVAAQHGVAFGDYLVLGVIRRSPAGRCAPSDVCETLHRTSGGMTLTLDRLQEAGWLKREPDPDDRRKIVLTLTATGRSLATDMNVALHAWESAIGASAQRTQAMLTALDDLLGLLEPQLATVNH